jgi:hypothetical protein
VRTKREPAAVARVAAAEPQAARPLLRLVGLASITVSFLAASAAPTPLYATYQAAWGFSAPTTTVVFGVYAIAFLAALVVVIVLAALATVNLIRLRNHNQARVDGPASLATATRLAQTSHSRPLLDHVQTDPRTQSCR